MRRMAAAAKDKYLDITSLEQIHLRKGGRFEAGYPAALSAEWWALRLRLVEIIAKQHRERKVRWTDEDIALSEAAHGAGLGDDDRNADYQRMNGAVHALESWAMRELKKRDPARYAAILAEAVRLNSLGRRVITADVVKAA